MNHLSQEGKPLRQILKLSPILLALCVACGDSRAESGPGEGPPGGRPGAGGEARATPVGARIAQPSELDVTLRGTANLQAREQVEILPKQTGVVSRVLVEEGARVSAGQPLAVLDAEEWTLQARQAEARAEAAQDAAQRGDALGEQGLLAEQELERLRSEGEVAAADRDLARLRVRNATIRSPIGGVVTHRYIERGQLVSTTTPAFAVADVSRLEAEVGVPEQEAQRVRAGQPVRILIEGFPEPVSGTVTRIRPVVDPTSGTVQVTVGVNASGTPALRAGQFVTVEIVTETLEDRITVPRTAVLVDGPRPRVFVVRGGMAEEREVTLGENEGERVEIREGLTASDTIIIVGQDALQPGVPVRLVELNGEAVPEAQQISPAARQAAAGAGEEMVLRMQARLQELGVPEEDARQLAERFGRGERREVMQELERRGIDPRELRPGGAPGGRGGPGGGRGS